MTKNATESERENIFPHLMLDVETKDINNVEDGDYLVERLNNLYTKLNEEPDFQLQYQKRVEKCLNILENNPDLASMQKEIINRTIATEGTINHILNTIFTLL